MRLTMVGTGYVGLVTGVCFANTGNDVVCLDLDERKIEGLRRGKSPIFEPGLTELIRSNVEAGRLRFTTNPAEAHREAQVIFICVGTPSDEQGRANLAYVHSAADQIGAEIKSLGARQDPKVVVVKSTVPVGATLEVRDRISRIVGGIPFGIANNPEFLKEGAAINDFQRPDRVIVGADDEETAGIMRELYGPFVRQGNPIFIMDILSSEMVKYASNAMLATKISFINEIACLCDAYGADIKRVREGMCADTRIGNQFLHPGLGYGGSCFPKDVLACISMGDSAGSPATLLREVHAVNQRQRRSFFDKLKSHFEEDDGLKGKTIAFWGLAFKPNTDDIREAPALSLIHWAQEDGASVHAYDPVAMDKTREQLGDAVTFFDDKYESLRSADALVICTDWDEFKSPDLKRMADVMRGRAIFDGRNLYRRQQMEKAGFSYHSVGRPPVLAPGNSVTSG